MFWIVTNGHVKSMALIDINKDGRNEVSLSNQNWLILFQYCVFVACNRNTQRSYHGVQRRKDFNGTDGELCSFKHMSNRYG